MCSAKAAAKRKTTGDPSPLCERHVRILDVEGKCTQDAGIGDTQAEWDQSDTPEHDELDSDTDTVTASTLNQQLSPSLPNLEEPTLIQSLSSLHSRHIQLVTYNNNNNNNSNNSNNNIASQSDTQQLSHILVDDGAPQNQIPGPVSVSIPPMPL